MELEIINKRFAVCKVKTIDNINFNDDFVFMGKTSEEISIVCEDSSIPIDFTECDSGWLAFKIKGTLDFSLVGILAKISNILAENNISIFAISTYDTDYILIKEERFHNAIAILKNYDYKIVD